MNISDIIKEELLFEEKKKTKKDACYYKVKSRYDVWPSAYASGALVKCRKVGAENWGESKKESEEIKQHNLILEKKLTSKPSSETSLKDWFGRKGEKGSTGGWVDCNAPDGKGGYKSCGRKEGEERSKYPACRPTPSACKEYKSTKGETWGKKAAKNEQISESLKYHLDNKIPLTENVFRFGSKAYLDLLKETRSLYFKGELKLNEEDEEFILSDAGTKGIYEGKEVWLDIPFEYDDLLAEAEYKGREVQLNHPMRNTGEGKKYMVYVKNPESGNVVKKTFGDKKGGLTAKISNPKARKSFASRHNCSEKKDKMSPGYWACRLTKFGHLFNGKTYPGYW
jgi:hypothetical protein